MAKKIRSIKQLQAQLNELVSSIDWDKFDYDWDKSKYGSQVKFDDQKAKFVAPQVDASVRTCVEELNDFGKALKSHKQSWLRAKQNEALQQALVKSPALKQQFVDFMQSQLDGQNKAEKPVKSVDKSANKPVDKPVEAVVNRVTAGAVPSAKNNSSAVAGKAV